MAGSGGSAGGIILLVIVGIAIYYFYKRRKSTPPAAPGPTPAAPATGGTPGSDGIKQIYPTLAGGKEFFIGTSPDKTRFNVSYGTNSHIAFSGPKTESGMVFYNTAGNPISYASGAAPGRSVRLDVYPGGGMWSNSTSYSWQSNPGYLYNTDGIASGEYTVYIRPHGSLGTHQSCAWKIGGRDEDAIRSLFEICAADGQHSAPFANWNYAHFPYVSCPVTLSGTHGKMTAEEWIGVKAVRIVDPAKKFCDFYLYEDSVVAGKPANQWKLTGHAHDAGTSGYKNIPCTWKSHKDLIRIDGFQNVDFAFLSTRPIAATTPAAAAHARAYAASVFNSSPGTRMSTVIETDNYDSVEEARMARKKFMHARIANV